MAQEKNVSTTASHPVAETPARSKSMAIIVLQNVALYSFLAWFAVFSYFNFLAIALFTGSFFQKPTERDAQVLAKARDELWNLSKQPIPGFRHAFFKLRSGHRLHFISNRDPNGTTTPADLVVFIHGFPDSMMIWRHLLQEPDMPGKLATFVCVDLPGYGGSDSFDRYDTRVLDALSEFIVAMRERYTQDADGMTAANTYVCGHDWGCVLTYRLAAEAPGLADRFLVTNGPLANRHRIVGSASKIFKQFRAAPTKNLGLLKKSFITLKPLLAQLVLSNYIFVFHLPAPMVKYLATGGYESFPRGVAQMAARGEAALSNVFEALAAVRPGPVECTTSLVTSSKTDPNETYGPTVMARAKSTGLSWWHMTAYYRQGASFKPWDKSLETITDLYNLETSAVSSSNGAQKRRSSSASSALFTEQYKGSLRAPTTVLWGAEDGALSRAICLDGIGDYLTKESEVILLPRSGHWLPLEQEGRAAWATVIKTLIDKPKDEAAPDSVFDAVQHTYKGAQLLVRR